MIRYSLYYLEGKSLEEGIAESRQEVIQKVYFEYDRMCKFFIIETNLIRYEFKKIVRFLAVPEMESCTIVL